MNEPLLSHPDKKLSDHLLETAKIAVESIRKKEFDFSIDLNGKQYNITTIIPNIIYLAAAFHDLGKATSFFQHYIRNPKALHDNRKNHALLSALFVFFVTFRYLQNTDIDDDLKLLLSIFSFSAVKRHHGRLDNLANEIFFDDNQKELVTEQIHSIDNEKIMRIVNTQLIKYPFKIKWEEFRNFVENQEYDSLFQDFSFNFLVDQLKLFPNDSRITLFYIHQLIYAALLFADKNEVILENGKASVSKSDISGKVELYREVKGFNHPVSEINKLKNQSYFESANQLEKVFDKNQHIYSVTLPTGLGKTITAFMLADMMRKMTGFSNSKIIINIPFTSIIDQNFDVYADILQTTNSDVLLKHHHLAEPLYKTNENIAEYDQSKFLIETWQSDTVVTTFVQLLETLLSCDKAKLMKFPNITNAIILLDEIQTIPYELWETIRKTFHILGKKFNLYFILISATQPLIFNPGEDIFELVPDYKKYFNFFNRTQMIVHQDSIQFGKFKEIVSDYVLKNSQNNILAIVNTKKAAFNLFEYIRNEIDTKNTYLYFLTTLITPYERKRIIQKIKEKSEKQKVIISTQLVEAGVDISVDTVFRQLSPLDSIIQSAGRANRYSERNQISDVYIYDIEDLKKASNYIYGSDLLIKTKNILKEIKQIKEQDYIELIKKYFVEVRKQSDNTTNKVLNAIENLEFAEVNLKMINEIKADSVFVQLNKRAKDIWQEYVKIYSDQTLKPWERAAKFSKIKGEFYDYVINVPIPWERATIIFDSEKEYGFYVWKLDNPGKNYTYSPNDFTQNTGYYDQETTVEIL